MTQGSSAPRRRRLFRSGHAYEDIAALLAEVEPKGLCLDFPSGTGVNVPGIRKAGFEPVVADLFPEEAADEHTPGIMADFTRPLPFADQAFAAVLCSEGIEHCSRQLELVREFARVLKPGGTLIITTPNILNLRARLSYLLNGHSSFARAPVTEFTQVRRELGTGGVYIGHAFLLNYFQLRLMLKLAGFEGIGVSTAKYSTSAVLLAPLLWLPVRLATARLLKRFSGEEHRDHCTEILSHVTSADVLFGKKLIITARKVATGSQRP